MAIRRSKKAGIKEIADRAKVSIGTVDRVLHNREGVSNGTREKVLKIISEMNYEPNLLAKALASKKSWTFATLIPESTRGNSYWQAPHAGIERAAEEIRNYGVTILQEFFDHYDPSSFLKKSEQILQANPDAILFAPVFHRESVQFCRRCDEKDIPYVFIDSLIPDQNNLSYFGQNAFRSGFLAAKLFDFGLPEKASILLIQLAGDTPNYSHLVQRENGFRTYFEKHGKSRKIITIEIPGILEIELRVVIQGQLKNQPDIKGIFVTSNVQRVARILDQYPFEKPRLIGYDLTRDNLDFLEKGIIDFVIDQKPEQQGYQGVMCLFNHLVLNRPVPRVHYSSLDIVTRENIPFELDHSHPPA
jgi:LacI family transcriptional regulator